MRDMFLCSRWIRVVCGEHESYLVVLRTLDMAGLLTDKCQGLAGLSGTQVPTGLISTARIGRKSTGVVDAD